MNISASCVTTMMWPCISQMSFYIIHFQVSLFSFTTPLPCPTHIQSSGSFPKIWNLSFYYIYHSDSCFHLSKSNVLLSFPLFCVSNYCFPSREQPSQGSINILKQFPQAYCLFYFSFTKLYTLYSLIQNLVYSLPWLSVLQRLGDTEHAEGHED